MRMRLRVALTVKSRAAPLPGAMATPSTWWRKLFSPLYDLGGWDAFSKIVTTALHCCHAGMVIYMRDTKGDTHIETESVRMLGVPQKPAERTFHISHFILHPQPPLHIFPHTLVPFPILSLSLSFSPRHLQLGGEEMLKCQSDSENFLEKSFHFLQPLNRLPSLPLPPLEA